MNFKILHIKLYALFCIFVASISLHAANAPIVVGTKDAVSPTKVHLSSNYSLGSNMTIAGPVIIVADGDFNIGNNVLTIAEGGSLQLYVEGNVKMSGNGAFNNANVAENLQIWGTAKSSQTIVVNGNGFLSAVVYAPYATVDSNGGGNAGALLGAVVANTISFSGNPGPFHFDEALLDLQTELSEYQVRSYDLVYDRSEKMTGETGEPSYEDYIQGMFKKVAKE